MKIKSATQFCYKHQHKFEYLLKTADNKSGVASIAEDYFKDKMLKDNLMFSFEVLIQIFIKSYQYNDTAMMTSILHMISHFDYNYYFLVIPALALVHPNNEVQDYAIKCFENWEEPIGAAILKNFKFETKWLQEYADGVVADLNEKGFPF